jgi:hypothetical protein
MSKNKHLKPFDATKVAAKYLIENIQQNHGVKIGSSHSHAAISGLLGYRSKKALLSDYPYEAEEENFIHCFKESNIKQLTENIIAMKDSPLKALDISAIAEVILDGLTPECECGTKCRTNTPVFTESTYEIDLDLIKEHACTSCVRDYPEEYGHCRYCGEDILYTVDSLNENGECSEHEGESEMSEEDRQGWESNIRRWNEM